MVVSDDRLMLSVRRIGEVLLSLIHLKACVWWSWCLTVALAMREPLSLSLFMEETVVVVVIVVSEMVVEVVVMVVVVMLTAAVAGKRGSNPGLPLSRRTPYH